MTVNAVKKYAGENKDAVQKFHGNQLLYIGWEDHLMFCAPFAFLLPPALRLGEVVEKLLPGAFSYHPDWAKVNWSEALWFKSGKPWTPDFDKSLAENGLKHKDVIRFRTPGLTGIKGSCT